MTESFPSTCPQAWSLAWVPQDPAGDTFLPQNLMLILNHNENEGEFSLKTQGLGVLPACPETIPLQGCRCSGAIQRFSLEDSWALLPTKGGGLGNARKWPRFPAAGVVTGLAPSRLQCTALAGNFSNG